MIIALCIALSLSAAPASKPAAKKKDTTSATQKDAIKGAIAVDSAPAADADGGTAAPAEEPPPKEGPDTRTMPFTPESVKTVVAYWQPKIQQCYEETLAAKDKAVEGKLMTKWIVGANGTVKKAEVLKKGTTLKDPKLYDCVITVLSSMQFPKTPSGKDQPIEFPFNLKAVH